MNRSVRLPEEEARPGGMKGVRLQHQGHLPWFGEIAIVKVLVGLGEKNLAARVGVVPADGLQPVRIPLRRRQQLRQSRPGLAGKARTTARTRVRNPEPHNPRSPAAPPNAVPAEFRRFQRRRAAAKKTRPPPPGGYRPALSGNTRLGRGTPPPSMWLLHSPCPSPSLIRARSLDCRPTAPR